MGEGSGLFEKKMILVFGKGKRDAGKGREMLLCFNVFFSLEW